MTIDTSIVLITWCQDNSYRLPILKKSFESLKECTKRSHILMVVDNGEQQQREFLREQGIDIHIETMVNLGVGASRNHGSKYSNSKYIAFVDNDILYFDNWLNECIGVLEKFPDQKLIATPRKTSPMKMPKHHTGDIGEYELYNRCSGQCLVFRRKDFEEIGQWSLSNTPGGDYCYSARKKKYRFIWHPSWNCKHLCKKSSYNYRHKLVNGQWIKESKT